jgi:HK97 family phage prohead protease
MQVDLRALYPKTAATERKVCRLPIMVVKAEDGETGRLIEGYATTYDPPEQYDAYGDIVAPGAFSASLETIDALPMLNSHGAPIGIWREFEEDRDGRHGHSGLYVRGKVSRVREGDETLTLIGDGAIRGLSIGFEPLEIRELDLQTRWGYPVREIVKGELMEVSPTAIPANRNAQIVEVRDRRRSEHRQAILRRARPVEKAINLGVALDSMIDKIAPDGGRGEAMDRLAEASGIARADIEAIITGDLERPPIEALEAISGALEVDSAILIGAAESDGYSYETAGEGIEIEAEIDMEESERRAARILELIGEIESIARQGAGSAD